MIENVGAIVQAAWGAPRRPRWHFRGGVGPCSRCVTLLAAGIRGVFPISKDNDESRLTKNEFRYRRESHRNTFLVQLNDKYEYYSFTKALATAFSIKTDIFLAFQYLFNWESSIA